MNSENQRHTRLQKLSGSDFEIADGQPDISGWKIKDASGKQLGKVDDLIFDYESRKVRYIVADLKTNDYHLQERDILIPIGIAELHKEDDHVILPGVTVDQINNLPGYDADRFDTSHETNVRNVFGGLGTGGEMILDGDPGFYDHDHFNEDNLLRNRRGSTTATDFENTSQEKLNELSPETAKWLRSKNLER